jgi:catechol 2,3-dioxygenase-like lactoylglutathione lyase family enzyme
MDDRGPRLSHLFVTAPAPDEMRRFYVELLGLRVLLEEDGYLRIGGGGGFHLGIEAAERDDDPAIELNVEVPDVDAAYHRLRDHGVAFDAPPQDVPWGARHAWLRDPAGHRLSLYSRRDSA